MQVPTRAEIVAKLVTVYKRKGMWLRRIPITLGIICDLLTKTSKPEFKNLLSRRFRIKNDHLDKEYARLKRLKRKRLTSPDDLYQPLAGIVNEDEKESKSSDSITINLAGERTRYVVSKDYLDSSARVRRKRMKVVADVAKVFGVSKNGNAALLGDLVSRSPSAVQVVLSSRLGRKEAVNMCNETIKEYERSDDNAVRSILGQLGSGISGRQLDKMRMETEYDYNFDRKKNVRKTADGVLLSRLAHKKQRQLAKKKMTKMGATPSIATLTDAPVNGRYYQEPVEDMIVPFLRMYLEDGPAHLKSQVSYDWENEVVPIGVGLDGFPAHGGVHGQVDLRITPLIFGRRNQFTQYEMALAAYDGSDHSPAVWALIQYFCNKAYHEVKGETVPRNLKVGNHIIKVRYHLTSDLPAHATCLNSAGPTAIFSSTFSLRITKDEWGNLVDVDLSCADRITYNDAKRLWEEMEEEYNRYLRTRPMPIDKHTEGYANTLLNVT